MQSQAYWLWLFEPKKTIKYKGGTSVFVDENNPPLAKERLTVKVLNVEEALV